MGRPVRELQERGAVGPSVTAARSARRPSLPLAVAAVAAAVLLDQLTKTLALHRLADGPVHVIWTLQLAVYYNDGVAFSLGRGSGLAIVPVALVVVFVVVWSARSLHGRLAGLALGLVVGGASSNVLDRLVRGDGGSVVDFIDLQWWPVFNVADMCVVCGGILLGVLSLVQARPPTAHEG